MALFVNARTYQVLYIIRQLARADKDATATAISGFIAERRHAAPDTYANAYIPPGNLSESLQRLAQEGVLTRGPAFQMTPKGSQMADVLDDVDACTTTFIEGYKGLIVEAALKQRVRVGLPPATQQDLAQATGLSVDSVRRGLSELEGKVITTATGRVQTYTLSSPPAAQAATSDDPLAGFDDSPLVPTPDPEVSHDPEDPESTVDIAKLLEGIDDSPPTAPVPEPCDPDEEDAPGDESPGWDDVPRWVRDGFAAKAQAAGLSLTEFLIQLDRRMTAQIQIALFGKEVDD